MKIMRAILRGQNSVTMVFAWVGYLSIIILGVLTFIDVMGRYFLNRPLSGSYELTELAMVSLGGAAILYTTTRRGHIVVDLLFVRFPKKVQLVIASAGSFFGAATWGFIAYQVYLQGSHWLASGNTTAILLIPLAPLQFILALGLFLHSLTLLMQAFPALSLEEKPPEPEDGAPQL